MPKYLLTTIMTMVERFLDVIVQTFFTHALGVSPLTLFQVSISFLALASVYPLPAGRNFLSRCFFSVSTLCCFFLRHSHLMCLLFLLSNPSSRFGLFTTLLLSSTLASCIPIFVHPIYTYLCSSNP